MTEKEHVKKKYVKIRFMNTEKKSFKKSGIIFLVLVVILFAFVFHSVSLNEVIESIRQTDQPFIILGILMMVAYLLCDALNIYRPLHILGYPISYLQSIKYSILGFFFSYITPSATGGQPMQIYYMYKDDINVSHSALVLIIQLIGHETAITTLAIIGFISQNGLLTKAMGQAKYTLLIGIVVNVLIDLFMFCVVFFKKTARIINRIVVKIAGVFSKNVATRIDASLKQVYDDYQNGADDLKAHKGIIRKTVLTAFFQMLFMFTVPFCVYLGFHLHQFHWFQITMIEAVLFVAVGFVPLPGAIGASEGLFYILFRVLFPSSILTSAMLLTRCINLYFCLVIDGLLILWFTHCLKKRGN